MSEQRRNVVSRLLGGLLVFWHKLVGRRGPVGRRARKDRPYVVTIIPAHNEETSIGATLESLFSQTRQPDLVVVAADNCSDRTVEVASSYRRRGVVVFETVDNKYRKVGALTQAWQRYAKDADFVLGIDADTILAPSSLQELEDEMVENVAIGGLMARYTFDQGLATGWFSRLLVRLQRLEFTGWTMDILRRQRRTYVLGGQATLFRGEALRQVTEHNKRNGPWSVNSQVEDMELTWRLGELGWETLCSATARAYVGPMLTFRAFWAQRRKWDGGITQTLLANGINKQTAYPWRLQAKTLLDASIRFMFFGLLILALLRGSWVWFWVWAIPPVLAMLLNLRTVLRTPHRSTADIVVAVTLVGSELYLMVRIATWAVSWVHAILGIRKDGWAAQYRAEGKA